MNGEFVTRSEVLVWVHHYKNKIKTLKAIHLALKDTFQTMSLYVVNYLLPCKEMNPKILEKSKRETPNVSLSCKLKHLLKKKGKLKK